MGCKYDLMVIKLLIIKICEFMYYHYSTPEQLYYAYWNCRPGVKWSDPLSLYPPFQQNFYHWNHGYQPQLNIRQRPYSFPFPQETQMRPQTQDSNHKNDQIHSVCDENDENDENSIHESNPPKQQSLQSDKIQIKKQSNQQDQQIVSISKDSNLKELDRDGSSGRMNKNRKSNFYRVYFKLFQDPEFKGKIKSQAEKIIGKEKLSITYEEFLQELENRVPELPEYFSIRLWRSLYLGSQDFPIVFRKLFQNFKKKWGKSYLLSLEHRSRRSKSAIKEMIKTLNDKDLFSIRKEKKQI